MTPKSICTSISPKNISKMYDYFPCGVAVEIVLKLSRECERARERERDYFIS